MKETALPCFNCKTDFDTGPSWNDDESLIWWDCECGLEGKEALTEEQAIKNWNDMIIKLTTNTGA